MSQPLSFCTSATDPQYQLKFPHGQLRFSMPRHTKQNSILQLKHFICLHPEMCYIGIRHPGHSLMQGTITDTSSPSLPISRTYFLSWSSAQFLPKLHYSFPQSTQFLDLHGRKQRKQKYPYLQYWLEHLILLLPPYLTIAMLHPGHCLLKRISQFSLNLFAKNVSSSLVKVPNFRQKVQSHSFPHPQKGQKISHLPQLTTHSSSDMIDCLPMKCPHGILATPCYRDISSSIWLSNYILETSAKGILLCVITSFRVSKLPIQVQSGMRFPFFQRIISLGRSVWVTFLQMISFRSLQVSVVSMQTCCAHPLARRNKTREMLGGSGSPQRAIERTSGLFCLLPMQAILLLYHASRTDPTYIHSRPPRGTSTFHHQELLPNDSLPEFKDKERITISNHIYITAKQGKKYVIEQSCNLSFSQGVQGLTYYSGLASGLLASSYSYSVKTINPPPNITVALHIHSKQAENVISLANARLKSVIFANGRGDHFGSPSYFVQRSKALAQELGLGITVISADQLKKQGMNLFHAVGRASNKEPAMINLSYNGDKASEEWLALIGKGICFDSGGLDLKGTQHLGPMFLDKSGACSCLAAIQYIARQNLPINVTATVGMAQNFISCRSYRPGDIIKSKKGLTVEIADTDAQGRLVLADSMTWTQSRYKVTRMVQLSTLTYSIIVGLGNDMAGLFGNTPSFSQLLRSVGEEVLERSWIMPLEESHQEFLISKGADMLSDANDTSPGGTIAAAFLANFVQEGVQWIHLDVAGPCIKLEERIGTGYGARLLLQLARTLARK